VFCAICFRKIAHPNSKILKDVCLSMR